MGNPFNVSCYDFITQGMAATLGYKAVGMKIIAGDTHIYSNHVDQIKEQLTREPLEQPKLKFKEGFNLFDWKIEDVELLNYIAHPAIKGAVSK